MLIVLSPAKALDFTDAQQKLTGAITVDTFPQDKNYTQIDVQAQTATSGSSSSNGSPNGSAVATPGAVSTP